MSFRFVDLFAGIGGFHAVLSSMGGECCYAVEIDPQAAAVYRRNWGIDPLGDITNHVSESKMVVPEHDVLVAGFPCQPFSKSGAQRGMEETRGTLYWNILQIIKQRHPAMVLLENVRNLAGPRHAHEWAIIIKTLREEGYAVHDNACVFSPHLLPPELGGRPQVRERVFIVALRADGSATDDLSLEDPIVTNKPVGSWDPASWNLHSHLPLETGQAVNRFALTESETYWIDAWDEFVTAMWDLREGVRLPGFPLWGDDWRTTRQLDIPSGTPSWKAQFLRKNAEFYTEHRSFIDGWTKRWGFYGERFPPSRRKLEWQAQDTPRLWDTVLHFRPSGIRAKKPTYLPALVAITQTSIIGSEKRRLTTREAARLQGLPDWFDFGDQSDAATYRQLGNGVSVGAVWHVVKQTINRHSDLLSKTSPQFLAAAADAPNNPDDALRLNERF